MPRIRNISGIESKQSRSSQKSAVKDDPDDSRQMLVRQSTKRDLDIAQNALLQAEAQNTELKRALAECQGQVLKVKQDMMLDRIMQEDANVKKLHQAQKEKHGIQKCADAHKIVRLELERKLSTMTEKFDSTTARANNLQQDSDHLQAVIKILYGDLDELRQLESEEVARRKKQKQGLPPPYQDFRRRDQQAPYEQHTDNGSFDENKLEDTVKEDFDDALIKAHKDRVTYLKSDNITLKTKGNSIIFTATANALAVACLRLRPVLRSTDDMHDWIAEFLLELSWIAVSACEVRPTTIYLTTQEKNRAGLAFREVDELLLEALKQGFDDIDPEYELLVYELQTHLTRTLALQKSFMMVNTRTGYDYFDKTVEWLSEQVQYWRQMQANSS